MGYQGLSFGNIQLKFDQTKHKFTGQFIDFELSEKIKEIKSSQNEERTSEVHLFDVGQGSAILLIAKDSSTILIGTGSADDSEKKIISYLDKEIGLDKEIDLLIFPNNNLNQIGHGHLVLDYFDVKEVWLNGASTPNKEYSRLTKTIENLTSIEYKEPKAGETITKEAFEIEVLHPQTENAKQNQEDESLAVRIKFDGLSLITTGDLFIESENKIVDEMANLQSDLLILGNRGSNDSTGEKWIDAVQPQVAVYQAPTDHINEYPRNETIARLEAAGVAIYGADELGELSIYIDENGEFHLVGQRE